MVINTNYLELIGLEPISFACKANDLPIDL